MVGWWKCSDDIDIYNTVAREKLNFAIVAEEKGMDSLVSQLYGRMIGLNVQVTPIVKAQILIHLLVSSKTACNGYKWTGKIGDGVVEFH